MKQPLPAALPLAVVPLSADAQIVAAELAARLDLPLLAIGTDPKKYDENTILVLVGEDGIALKLSGAGAPGEVAVDFGSGAMRHRRKSGNNELLGKAVGVGKKARLSVLDATAGLGRDSFVLADLGCEVLLSERNPVIAELLRVGIERACTGTDSWLAEVALRMQLLAIDAQSLGVESLAAVDVIYLDPMFPGRDKRAAVKKEMVLLQSLLGPQDDADALLEWALQQAVARVVVKRPPRAPTLAGRAPSHCISGKAVRYDVHVLRGLG